MKALIARAVPPIPPSHATMFLPRTATVIEQMAVGGLAGPQGNHRPDDAGGRRAFRRADAADGGRGFEAAGVRCTGYKVFVNPYAAASVSQLVSFEADDGLAPVGAPTAALHSSKRFEISAWARCSHLSASPRCFQLCCGSNTAR